MDTDIEIRFRTPGGHYHNDNNVSRIRGILIYGQLPYDDDYDFVAQVDFIDLHGKDGSLRIGCPDTWLKVGNKVYRTEGDFHRLESELERERVADLLEAM